jgi:hypothetical protein
LHRKAGVNQWPCSPTHKKPQQQQQPSLKSRVKRLYAEKNENFEDDISSNNDDDNDDNDNETRWVQHRHPNLLRNSNDSVLAAVIAAAKASCSYRRLRRILSAKMVDGRVPTTVTAAAALVVDASDRQYRN